ncbi:MAG: hypothetical protein K0Q87_1894, partial [Neobacillus sp.]|nr:hypothetical protein [Neobacillus sp.]
IGMILAVPTLAILKVGLIHAKNHFIEGKAKEPAP